MSELATLVHQTMLMKVVAYQVIGCFHHLRDAIVMMAKLITAHTLLPLLEMRPMKNFRQYFIPTLILDLL